MNIRRLVFEEICIVRHRFKIFRHVKRYLRLQTQRKVIQPATPRYSIAVYPSILRINAAHRPGIQPTDKRIVCSPLFIRGRGFADGLIDPSSSVNQCWQ